MGGARRGELVTAVTRTLSTAGLRVQDVTVASRAVDDFAGDMWVTVTYRIPRFAAPVDGRWSFASPLLGWLHSGGNFFGAGSQDWAKDRSTDVMLWNTQLVDAVETMTLPRGWKLQDPPTAETVKETYGTFAGSVAQAGRVLTVTAKATVERRQVPPSGYGGFRKAVQASRDWSKQAFTFVREGK